MGPTQYQQSGLGRDGDTNLIVHLEATATLPCLFRNKDLDEVLQAGGFLCIKLSRMGNIPRQNRLPGFRKRRLENGKQDNR